MLFAELINTQAPLPSTCYTSKISAFIPLICICLCICIRICVIFIFISICVCICDANIYKHNSPLSFTLITLKILSHVHWILLSSLTYNYNDYLKPMQLMTCSSVFTKFTGNAKCTFFVIQKLPIMQFILRMPKVFICKVAGCKLGLI